MRARWVFRDEPYDAKNVGTAVIASWFPGRYYKISTIEGPSSEYITQVAKCDKMGWVGNWLDNTVYEREYKDRADALRGHEDVLSSLTAGGLKLSKVRPR
jgi:hypothetical protein